MVKRHTDKCNYGTTSRVKIGVESAEGTACLSEGKEAEPVKLQYRCENTKFLL